MILPPALRYRKFTLLWAGLMVSIAGSQMQFWALFWHVRVLTDSPIAISLIGVVRFLPILVFSLVGGLVADMFDRRKILFITQTTMLVAFGLWALTGRGTIQLWHIYALTAVQAVALSFDMPARQALTPNLVPRADLPSAFSMKSIWPERRLHCGAGPQRGRHQLPGAGVYLFLQCGLFPGGAGSPGADGSGGAGPAARVWQPAGTAARNRSRLWADCHR